MRNFILPRRIFTLVSVCVALAAGNVATAADPVALRAESFVVTPSTGPLAIVDVKNLLDASYQGSVAMTAPEGWQIAPAARDVSLAPGELRRVSFAIERGRDDADNSYPIEVSATGGGVTVVRRQNVVVASAPYFKPVIDGDLSEWKDAIPVTFTSGGKKTTVSTYWNRRQFAILIAVEEDRLVRFAEAQVFDAVQLSISPQEAVTGTSPNEKATRFEFLFRAAADDDDGKGDCFQLATPGKRLSETATVRSLGPLAYDDAQVAVAREDGVTYYECSLPFGPMRGLIRPSEGREFRLSVLVHDPDGTGIRDLGQAAGLWPSQRNALAWSRWTGAKWGEKPPFDNKIEWGLCSSQY